MSLTSAGTATQFTAHKITATNSALTTWPAPTQLSCIGPNYIDTIIVKVVSTYHAFTRNETTNYTEYATASSLTGPYPMREAGDWAGFRSWVEGPALVPLDNGGRRIYYDGYSAGNYWYSDSCDHFATWTLSTELPGLTGFARHLTVLKETVPGDVTLPMNTTRSLRSVNCPDRYAVVRSDSLGCIDPVTTSSHIAVTQSATLTVVPGLADAGCYSFRDSSGRYPRHYDHALRVDLYQNTDTFRADSSSTVVTP